MRFAVIGVDHPHVYELVEAFKGAHAEFACWQGDGDPASMFAKVHAGVPRMELDAQILNAPDIDLIIGCGIPNDRTRVAIAALEANKHVVLDKPGAVTMQDLDRLVAVQKRSKRVASICFSEVYNSKTTSKALELVQAGAIGKIVNVTSSGPHRLRAERRPDWFWDPARNGGILADILSHQAFQFLVFADCLDAHLVFARARSGGMSARPGFCDFGEALFVAGDVSGYTRVDWLLPEGLGQWGDIRATVTGSSGYLDIRKTVDLGRPGAYDDTLFLVDQHGVQRVDCSDTKLSYATSVLDDMNSGPNSARNQARCFAAMRLALTAQDMADAR